MRAATGGGCAHEVRNLPASRHRRHRRPVVDGSNSPGTSRRAVSTRSSPSSTPCWRPRTTACIRTTCPAASSWPPTVRCRIPLTCLRLSPARPPRSAWPPVCWCCPTTTPWCLRSGWRPSTPCRGGRLRLCVGVGWLREEIEACGAPFERRGRRADEQIEVMRLLWARQSGGREPQRRVLHVPRRDLLSETDSGSATSDSHRWAQRRRRHARGTPRRRFPTAWRHADSRWKNLVGVMRDEAARAGRDPEAASTVARSPRDEDRPRQSRETRRPRRRPHRAGHAGRRRRRTGQGHGVGLRSTTRTDGVNPADRLALSDLVHRYAAGVDDRRFRRGRRPVRRRRDADRA